jgi:signal transduction histidine kinase
MAPGARRMVQICQRSIERTIALVSDILDLCRFEAGNMSLDRRDFDIVPVLEECTESMAAATGGAVELRCDLPPTLTAHGDRKRIVQVVRNLVENALKFTRAGQVVVRAGRGEEGVVVSVADTGVGIPPERRHTVFEKFRDSETRGSPVYVGGGFGLAIAKAIVNEHGGRIWVESKMGQGSTFHFSLPAS